MDDQEDSEYLERYKRHILIRNIGGQGQRKLVKAKVLVVGLGGIGSTVLQHLAAVGIGKIGLVDRDNVELSNLQRQTIYTCLLYTSPSPRDGLLSRMPSSA